MGGEGVLVLKTYQSGVIDWEKEMFLFISVIGAIVRFRFSLNYD